MSKLADRNIEGLTLDDTCYLTPPAANNLRIHFHELVHVAQWQHLGLDKFIARYLEELTIYGYDGMPLEKMAHDLDARFVAGGPVVDVRKVVREGLEAQSSGLNLCTSERE